MPRAPLALLLVAVTLLSMSGCTASVGDSCETNVSCLSISNSATCDLSVFEGYCTVRDCVRNNCPDDAVCVRFDEVNSYCMRACDVDDECRSGHTCRRDRGEFSSMGFCYVAPPS